jgi:tripartite-type tricarboxylate transporter receptor subunit TctC
MKIHRIAAFLAAAATALAPAWAQDYPTKPIEIVIPFAPGGISDMLIRTTAPKLQEELKQPIIVLNKPGANGNTHSATAMQAAPDGYTLLQTPLSTLATNPAIYGDKLPYNDKTMVLVTPLATLPLFLVVNPAVMPVKTLKEFLDYLKKNPGSQYASAGIGGSNHLAGEMLRHSAGVEITHVPFSGSAPALNSVLGGHVPWMFDSGRVLQHVKSGKLNLIAIATEKRLPEHPDVPVLNEVYPGFVANGWHGVAAPPGTPKAIVAKLNAAYTKALNDPAVKAKLATAALLPYTATPEEYAAFVAAESKKWSEIIRKSNVKAE